MPFARKSDPQTSHDAAESVKDISKTQRAIYAILLTDPATDENLVKAYREFAQFTSIPMASESGIRSRRADLVKLGMVKPVGFDKTASGRKTTVWGVK